MGGILVRIGLAIACMGAATAMGADTFDELLGLALRTHPAVEGAGPNWAPPGPNAKAVNGSGIRRLPSRRPRAHRVAIPACLRWSSPCGRAGASVPASARPVFARRPPRAAVVEAKQTIAFRLVGAYTDALRQRERQAFARTSVDEHERLLQLIDRRVQQDVSPPVDRDFARARLAQVASELSLANQGLQVAHAQLDQLAGRPVTSVMDVRLDGRAIPDALEEALVQAVERSPVLARLDQTALAAAEDVESRRAVIMPQLALRLEHQVGAIDDSRALIVLRAQPGAGLSAGSAIAAARQRQEEARLARADAERTVKEQVQTAFVEWRAAQVRLENARLSAGMAQAVFDSYTRQYVAGRKTWIDVLNAVREVSQSQFSWRCAGPHAGVGPAAVAADRKRAAGQSCQ